MTPGFTNENQAYKRTVYLPQSHIAIYFFFNKYIDSSCGFFFFDDTRIRTSEGHQDYKRTVYVLDHNMSQQQSWCIHQYDYFTNIYEVYMTFFL